MPERPQNRSSLLERLDWSNPLIQQALCHRSATSQHNERLEFLGDAVLSQVVSGWLFHNFPAADEGMLTRARSHVVRKETLLEVALSLGVSDRLKLGASATANSACKDSILADAVEAIIGAYYLSAGLQAAQDFIMRAFAEPLAQIQSVGIDIDRFKDAKSLLQEHLQRLGHAPPAYAVCEQTPDKRFIVICRAEPLAMEATASASTRRRAEQLAAQKILSHIEP